MRLRPDFERTATGWLWLDWLTAPYWFVSDRWTRRQFGRLFALKGESWRDGERRLREYWKRHEGQVGGVGMKPIVYMIGSSALEHGERAELDPEHPEACLCGFENYMLCPHADEGISSWTIYPAEETP